MIHLTLNTGHSRTSPRSEVRDDVVETMRPWTVTGVHRLPVGGCSLRTDCGQGGMLATVYDPDHRPIATIAVAGSVDAADGLWGEIERLYLIITDQPVHRSADWAVPRQPGSVPWCAVVLPAVHSPIEYDWLGDFERCLAWSFLERINVPT